MGARQERAEDEAGSGRRAGGSSQPLGVWWLAGVGLAAAGLLLFTENVRDYGLALGGSLLGLALLRAVLPVRYAGGLAVRGRWVDVVTLTALGAAVAFLATTLRLG